MAVNSYDTHERERRETAHLAYTADPAFRSIEAEAMARGFRKATLSEINSSAERRGQHTPDLYSWNGGLWVRA